MKVLLIKPHPGSVQFGLAPFFQTEPLGLEYVATSLQSCGHSVRLVDLRFEPTGMRAILERERPQVAGISCVHILDVPATMRLAREIKGFDRSIHVVVGGHAASAYPSALADAEAIDAVCIGEGERVMADLCDALQTRGSAEGVPSVMARSAGGAFERPKESSGPVDLGGIAGPDHSLVAAYQRRYCCLNYMPVWTMETTRGCPYRCRFCSVWQFYRGTCRFHSPANVRRDFEAIGHNVFVIDDIFWAEKDRGAELARALLRSPERKAWMLVQSRVDLVAANGGLLELWRPLARDFDIFFGFESPTRAGLDSLNKDLDVASTVEAARTARRLGYGVTGNFIINPDYTEDDFAALWDFLDANQLYRVGFTILTPLPGTHYFESMREKVQVFDWSQYDLHHLLWQPRLPVQRFFELYCETWRRSVLNLGGRKKWWSWLRSVRPSQVPRMIQIMMRTQRLMDPKAYLRDHRIPCSPTIGAP